MSKTSYILIVLVFICFGIFVYIKYFSPSNTKLSTLVEQSEISEQSAQGNLFLSPASQTIGSGQTSVVDINLETQNVTPTVLQFEIAYDPMSLTPTQIIPGKYFTNPVILLNTINPRNGRISYALKCSVDFEKDKNAACGDGTSKQIAQIVFTVNPYAPTKIASLNIMPKTILETKESSEMTLKTTNAKVIIQGAATVLQATPSAVVIQ